MRRPIRCRLGCHRWSCEGQRGYWRCDGTHHCIRCGYRPKATEEEEASDDRDH